MQTFPQPVDRVAQRGQEGFVLSFSSVSKVYRSELEEVWALREVSLDVAAGEFLALVGKSGCGKSTLLNLAGAMDFPTSGTVSIAGQSTTGLPDSHLTRIRREKVGFVFQSFQLLHTLSVVENVQLPLLLGGLPDPRGRAMQALAAVELDALAERMPHQLSGGQMQRVAIARAMVLRPKVLLADEPTGNLDSQTGRVVMDLLRRLCDETKTTILMATHSADSADVADAIVHMRDGRIENVVRAS